MHTPPETSRGAGPLSSFRVRPRFRARVQGAPAAAHARLLAALADRPEHVVVRAFPGLVGLHFADEQRRAWSPRLLLNLEAGPDGSTLVEGVYGPETEIWSLFLYGYFFSGMIGVFSGVFGVVQLVIGGSAWALWVTAAMALVALGLYLAAQLGQKLGAWQTVELHQLWRETGARIGAELEA